jgi:hypothetical protein
MVSVDGKCSKCYPWSRRGEAGRETIVYTSMAAFARPLRDLTGPQRSYNSGVYPRKIKPTSMRISKMFFDYKVFAVTEKEEFP